MANQDPFRGATMAEIMRDHDRGAGMLGGLSAAGLGNSTISSGLTARLLQQRALGLSQAQYSIAESEGRRYYKKENIEAKREKDRPKNLIEELQIETDEWLKDIKL